MLQHIIKHPSVFNYLISLIYQIVDKPGQNHRYLRNTDD